MRLKLATYIMTQPRKWIDAEENLIRILNNELEKEGISANWLTERISQKRKFSSALNLTAFEQVQYNAAQQIEEYLQSIGQEVHYLEITDQYKGFYIKVWLSRRHVTGTFVDYNEEGIKTFINNQKWQLNEIEHDGPEDSWPHYSQHIKGRIYGIGNQNVSLLETLKMFKQCTQK